VKKTEYEKREFWLEQMKIGRARFVLRRGVVDWGGMVGVGLFMFGIVSYGTHGWFRSFIICVSIGAVGGILVGLNSWYYYQKKYRSSSDRLPTDSTNSVKSGNRLD
jgi:hypothetical protein